MRREPGTGSITQRRDGRWMGQISLGLGGGHRIRRTVYGATRAEIEQRLELLLATGGDGLNSRTPGPPRPEAEAAANALGQHTGDQWLAKLKAIGCCIYCGSTGPLTQDHATPIRRGGSNGIENVVPACNPCNAAKGNLTAAEYLRRRLAVDG